MVEKPAELRVVSDVVDLIGAGYVGQRRAEELAERVPQLRYRSTEWLRLLQAKRDWRGFGRLMLVAAYVQPAGLGRVLEEVLLTKPVGLNIEDVLEIIGQIKYVEAVSAVAQFLRGSIGGDAPYYQASRKAICALGEIGTPDAREALAEFLDSAWPKPIRWYAAIELGIEDDLGFDENEMIQFY